jgi:hypothetical protein
MVGMGCRKQAMRDTNLHQMPFAFSHINLLNCLNILLSRVFRRLKNVIGSARGHFAVQLRMIHPIRKVSLVDRLYRVWMHHNLHASVFSR